MVTDRPVIQKLAILVIFFFSASLAVFAKSLCAEPGVSPHLLWATKMRDGKVKAKKLFEFSSPVVSDGRLFVGARCGAVCAVESVSGKKLWCYKTKGSVSTTPLLAADRLFFGDEKGILYSLQAGDGKELWHSQLVDDIMATPLLVGDTIYAATMNRRLVAVDASTGSVKWQLIKRGSMMKFSVRGTSNPVYTMGRIYVGYPDGSVVAHNPSDGSFIWTQQISTKKAFFQDVDTTPLISGDRLYIAATDGSTYCLDAKDGRIIWKAGFGSPNDLFLDGDRLFVSGGGILRALNPSTGQIIWEKDLNEAEISAPAARDGVVVVCSTREKIYMLDANNGEILYYRYLGKGTYGRPVFSGDSLYVLSNSGTLFAIEEK